MADTIGQGDIKGLNINKLLVGFADEPFVFKNDLVNSPTNAIEVRWWQKTSGNLTGTTTSSETVSPIRTTAFGTLPTIIEQSALRRTSYARHFSAETPLFTYSDLKDMDPDMFAANIRDSVRAIQNQQDFVILDTLSGGVPLSGSTISGGWGGPNGKPYTDLLSGAMAIRKQGYDITGLKAWMHPDDYKLMASVLVDYRGSSIPSLASSLTTDGVLTKVANVAIAVSNNATAGQTLILSPQKTATWKEFTPLTSATIENPGMGTFVRVWGDGVALLTDPYSACLIKHY